MLRGLYTAAAAMTANQRKHDMVTNNIANLNTPGFKEVKTVERSFPEMLIYMMDKQQAKQVGTISTGVFVEESLPHFAQGDLLETKAHGDLALVSHIHVYEEVDGVLQPIRFDASGKGIDQNGEAVYQPQAFFTLLDGNGERRYTRDGKMMIHPDGLLTTLEGTPVLGVNGQPIDLTLVTLATSNAVVDGIGFDQIMVGADGVLHEATTGEPLLDAEGGPVQLLISQVDNPYRFIREGNGAYRLAEPELDPPQQVADFTQVSVKQGYIERSNVDAAQATVDMMAALRAYEANQKVIQYYDRSLEKAVNEIGRVY